MHLFQLEKKKEINSEGKSPYNGAKKNWSAEIFLSKN